MTPYKFSFIQHGTDDQGIPLEVGRKYSVYQSNETHESGVLVFWNGHGWIDAFTISDSVPQELPLKGRFVHGIYEFATALPFRATGEQLLRITALYESVEACANE